MPVSEVRSGQTASFALKKVKRSQIRKGMVMVSAKLNPRACWEFHGDIMVLHHPTTIATRYQVIYGSGLLRDLDNRTFPNIFLWSLLVGIGNGALRFNSTNCIYN